jgi:hypothetical protein
MTVSESNGTQRDDKIWIVLNFHEIVIFRGGVKVVIQWKLL